MEKQFDPLLQLTEETQALCINDKAPKEFGERGEYHSSEFIDLFGFRTELIGIQWGQPALFTYGWKAAINGRLFGAYILTDSIDGIEASREAVIEHARESIRAIACL
jgi:hypothetical protein